MAHGQFVGIGNEMRSGVNCDVKDSQLLYKLERWNAGHSFQFRSDNSLKLKLAIYYSRITTKHRQKDEMLVKHE